MSTLHIQGLSGSAVAYRIGKTIEKSSGQQMVVTRDGKRARLLAEDLAFFTKKNIICLDEDRIGFLNFEARSREGMFKKLSALRKLMNGEDVIIVAPVTTALKRLPPKQLFKEYSLSIVEGESYPFDELTIKLIDLGYENANKVVSQGQFARRGSIFDVFVPGEERAYRIEFFDEDVESIREFDVSTQRSVKKRKRIEITPAEVLFGDGRRFNSAKNLIADEYEDERRAEIIAQIENRENLQQLEFYIEDFYDDTRTIFDYMGAHRTLFVDDVFGIENAFENLRIDWKSDFTVLMKSGKLVKADFRRAEDHDSLEKLLRHEKSVFFTPIEGGLPYGIETDEIRNEKYLKMADFRGRPQIFKKEINIYQREGFDIHIVTGNSRVAENVKLLLSAPEVDSRLNGAVIFENGYLSSGMVLGNEKICYMTAEEILGFKSRPKQKIERENSIPDKDKRAISSFSDIKKGDYVVHELYGVGKYIGIETIEDGDITKDYIKLKYAGSDRLFLPVSHMNQVKKYIGGRAANIKLYPLGGTKWNRVRKKVKDSVRKMVEQMLEVSAKRMINKGHEFAPDTEWQREFEDSFPYVETNDQIRAIEEIKADMESDKPMDRLLCGDVGYGKTEVAARAMFKCVMDGKQVALLVPTTILANQHYQVLKERFAAFPVKIDMLSRFKTQKEQRHIVEKIKQGGIDIVIGTHRLLSKDVMFTDLGLLIVDEEQRFGVSHKERIKTFRENVDVLTLSATPIPRTLHMAFIGMKDMSVIEEPPHNRLAVETYVMQEDEDIMSEAIRREISDGGQVFVIHNRIAGLDKIRKTVEKIVPEADILTAHGKMKEEELESVMEEFISGRADILISTTIIESGIDIPNVNTEIVIDADKFGLSQLYQIRGRVGRSDRQAYAYLFHKDYKTLTEDAYERLQAIKEFTQLGAGFKLAMRDLEIRGAGSLLGAEQSGHMLDVGYDMYCRIVEEVAEELKGEESKQAAVDTNINIRVSANIPKDYIEDEIERLTVYNRIAELGGQNDRKYMVEELEDRFGKIPKETRNLISIGIIKNYAKRLGITVITEKGGAVELTFGDRKSQPMRIFFEKGRGKTEFVEALLKDFIG